MPKPRILAPAIGAAILVLCTLAALPESSVNSVQERAYSAPRNIDDSAYGMGKRKATPIRADMPRPFDAFDISADSFCLIQNDDDNPAYFFGGFQPGSGFAVYLDPAQCGLPDPLLRPSGRWRFGSTLGTYMTAISVMVPEIFCVSKLTPFPRILLTPT